MSSSQTVRVSLARRVVRVRLLGRADPAPGVSVPRPRVLRAQPAPTPPASAPATQPPTSAPAPREHERLARGLAEALAAARGQALDELRGLDGRVAQLAIALAERIVGCEVKAGRYRLADRAEELLGRVRDRAEAVVHLHPADAAALGPAVEGLRWVADPELDRGDVVVETPAGRISRSIAEQLEAVRRAVLDEVDDAKGAVAA